MKPAPEVHMIKQILNDGIPAVLFMAFVILAVSLIESL